MDSPPANGWCSISCKWLSTFFTETSVLSTASKIYGATRRECIGKRRRHIDCHLLISGCIGLASRVRRDTNPERSAGLTAKPNYLGETEGFGAAAGVVFGAACTAACGAGVGGGLASSSSISKIRVELGPISGLMARSPYARFDGTHT